ncbi:MAG: hypothetical protein LBN25_00285 [Christensenellaceae bacterium]|jgi:endonuclease/exonuclease/phosphatase family metal-dependent hydrolase|nr:hypothetical protein [Christensenellaceae bacterium]
MSKYKKRNLLFSVLSVVFVVIFALSACSPLKRGNNVVYKNLTLEHPGVILSEITVATYNIKHCANGYDAVLNELKTADAQIIFIQEADRFTKRSGKETDQIAKLGEDLSLNYAFFQSIELEGGEYGVGILSYFEIESARSIALPGDVKNEPRTLGEVVISIYGKSVSLYTTHLSFEDKAPRTQQLAKIAETVAGKEFIIGADFNTSDLAELAVLNGSYVNDGGFITNGEDGAIDNIVYSSSFFFTAAAMQTSNASDHHLLKARLILA